MLKIIIFVICSKTDKHIFVWKASEINVLLKIIFLFKNMKKGNKGYLHVLVDHFKIQKETEKMQAQLHLSEESRTST